MTSAEYDWTIKIAKQVPTGLVTPIVEKVNLPIHQYYPIVSPLKKDYLRTIQKTIMRVSCVKQIKVRPEETLLFKKLICLFMNVILLFA